MRIAYTYHAFCRRPYTGISKYLTRLIANLDSRDYCEARVFAPIFTDGFLPDLKGTLVAGHQIPVNSALTRPAARCLNSLLAPRQLARWKPDLVHETYYSANSSAPPGCGTVLTIYDMIHEIYPADFHRWDRTRQLKKSAVSRADHIICISENTRQDLVTLLNVPPDKTSVIYLGVDDREGEAFHSTDAEINSTLRGRPFLLFIGQRGGYKNFVGFVKAYASSAWLVNEFDVICFGGGVFSRHELELLDSLKIGDRIYQLGGNDKVLSDIFDHATLFVYPSLYEGFGLPPLEAMAHGCAVACSNVSSIPEVVGNAGAYFDPNDIESIRATLEDVTASEEKRRELHRIGFAQRAMFTWKKCAAETFSVYQKLCKH